MGYLSDLSDIRYVYFLPDDILSGCQTSLSPFSAALLFVALHGL